MKKLLKAAGSYNRGLYVSMVVWGGYFLYTWPRMFWQSGGSVYAGHPFIWADWSAHLTYAAPFAYRAFGDWFMAHPLLATAQFSYPFLPDAVSGILVRYGVSVVAAFVIPSIVVSLILVYVLYRFFFHFVRSASAATLGVASFFCSGGLGFLVMNDQVDMATSIPGKNVYFMNNVVSELLPQRNFLFGLVITLVAVAVVERIVKTGKKRDVVLASVLAGLLCIVHPHSLIVLFVVSFCYMVAAKLHRWKHFLAYAAMTGGFFLVYFILLLDGNGGVAPRLQLGWMSKDSNFFYFLILNYGAVLPLFIIAVWRQRMMRLPLVWAAIILFVGSHVFVFQQWDWDNMKLLTYVYLFALLPVASWINQLWQTKRSGLMLVAVVSAISLVYSGAHDIWLATTRRTASEIITNTDTNMVTTLKGMIVSGDVVLTSQRPNQPLAMLSGAQLLLGYEGWVWSYGLAYSGVLADTAKIYSGDQQADELLSTYKIRYVVIDTLAKETYPVAHDYWNRHRVVYQDQQTTVYRIN